MKRIINNLFYKFKFLLVLNSPFVPLKLKWYFGPIAIGTPYFLPRKTFEFVPLGWKTKWDEFRFEWSPMLSVILFGKQLTITFKPDLEGLALDCYWEAWLYYHYRTDKELIKEQRLLQVMEMYSCKWQSRGVVHNYYNDIVKKKYLDYDIKDFI